MEFHYFNYDTDEVKKDYLCISNQSTVNSIRNNNEYIYTTYPIDINILGRLKLNKYKIFLHYSKDVVIEF